MSRSIAGKIKINSFADLVGGGEDGAVEVPLADLHDFRDHPFRVLDDEKMKETVQSIKEHGVLVPGIARPAPEGGYELISGHRRKRACELAGIYQEIKAEVHQCHEGASGDRTDRKEETRSGETIARLCEEVRNRDGQAWKR